MRINNTNPANWRDYQKSLKRMTRRRFITRRLWRLGLYAGGALLCVFLLLYTGPWPTVEFEEISAQSREKESHNDARLENLTKQKLRELLKALDLKLASVTGSFSLTRGDESLLIETSLDTTLQNNISKFLHRSKTHRAAVVVMNPENGQVLAMADYSGDGEDSEENLCLKADFPAASLFKIVSAAAAIEARGFTPNRPMYFRGQKYTLYKSQLRQASGRYVNETTFKRAFSGSINPVFGNLGIYDLGKELMTEYAQRFLFNKDIPFDLPVDVSPIQVPDDDFGLAEISTGFNKKTLISPLHAALITSAIVGNGKITAPWLVKSVRDESGKVLYSAETSILANPITEDTAQQMRTLMGDTVSHGTSRSAFRPLRRKKTFKETEFGAKSGTINDRSDQYKYDWLTAYALPKNGSKKICVAVLAVHGEKLGIRARDMARYVINRFYST